ncbi:MAG: hypothetical protein RIQ41_188 [Candidatus Parcubacteria bacterium]|jgi:glycosyltransferase involved in cell wall biosynthesis
MRFSIITPTYKRAEQLLRAVRSVQAQTYKDWEMIIVNDSPDDASYTSFATSIDDARIHYHANHTNSGVNASRNKALDSVSASSEWIIFLDDDDYLAPDTLQELQALITSHPNRQWFITNRAHKDGTQITQIPRPETAYSYIRDYLILRRCRGDVTHIIRTKALHGIRFPLHVKQGEEWLFFYQLGMKESMFYHDHNSTISDGYAETGLNFRKRSRYERLETLSVLLYEASARGFAYRPTFLLYLFIRLVRILFKEA